MNEYNYGTGLYQDGTFFFTNPGLYKGKDREGNPTTDWTAMWNNKEYTFKGKTTVPLIITGEPPENVQAIRRKFAFKYAQAVFHQSKRYQDMVKKGGFIPATYDEDTEFLSTIQACLTPLPKSVAEVKELPRQNENSFKGSKAVGANQDLNRIFEDYQPPIIGQV